jgi:hypothetical protein
MSLRRSVVLVLLAAAALPATTHATRLRPADRAAISRTLDVFVPAAIARHRPGRAYAVSAPSLRAAATRAQWRRGQLPVSPFPAVGTRFHGWAATAVLPGYASVDIQLRAPRSSKQGLTNWTIELRKIGGRWLVESALPTAFFPRDGSGSANLHAWNDLLPQASGTSERHGRLSGTWLLAPVLGFVGLVVALPAGLLIRNWRRNVRAYRRYARAGSR